MKAFYMVYLEGCSSPTFKHQDFTSAETEAKRLAKLHNRKAFILCTIKSFEINEFTVQDCRPDVELPF